MACLILCISSTVQSFPTTTKDNTVTKRTAIKYVYRTKHVSPLPLSQQQQQQQQHEPPRLRTTLYTTGGWGIGPQRELTPEEFATGGQLQNKKYFEGYQIRNRGEFMRQVAMDKEAMIRGEIDELLGVAAAAGLKVKNPKERLNKFDPSIIMEDEDEESLDVSVQWDDVNSNNSNDAVISTSQDVDKSVSITRLDEDTGSLGVW
jgi:hypothetical protein